MNYRIRRNPLDLTIDSITICQIERRNRRASARIENRVFDGFKVLCRPRGKNDMRALTG